MADISFIKLFVNLVNLVLTITWYIFHSNFYQKTDDNAMKGPTSLTTAELYMQAHEQTAMQYETIS